VACSVTPPLSGRRGWRVHGPASPSGKSGGWTYEELALRLGVAVSRVLELVALVRDEETRTAVEAELLSTRQAVVLAQGLRNSPELIAPAVAINRRSASQGGNVRGEVLLMSVWEPASLSGELPIGGDVSDQLYQRVAEGQPMLLLHDGRPVAVVVDLDSWEEVEALAAGE
jgi:hypothetical protein